MEKLLSFSTSDYPTGQFLAEMKLWNPPQGTTADVVPVNLDLRFEAEFANTASTSFKIFATKATIELQIENGDIVAGSRYGDQINEPYLAAEIIEQANSLVEKSLEGEGVMEVSLQKSPMAKLFATVKWRRKATRTQNTDHLVKISYQMHRVIARNKNRWIIAEPKPPRRLDGRYLGEVHSTIEGETSDPLCLLTIRKIPFKVILYLSVDQSDLDIQATDRRSGKDLDSNRSAVVSELVRRSVDSSYVNGQVLPMASQGSVICLACSILEAQYEI